MKKPFITSVISVAAFSIMFAQIHVDVKFGVSPASNPKSFAIIVNRENPHDEFQFNMIHTDPQYYGGIMAQVELNEPFFLEGGITYTKRNSLYQINYRMPQRESITQELVMRESEEMILLPMNIGADFGPIVVTSGLTLINTISDKSELTHLKGFSADSHSLRMGWQMGCRYRFNRTMAGVEYQGSMHRVCQGMYVNGHSLEIMNIPGRFVFTLQYHF